MTTRGQSEEKTMEHRPFGSTKREVAIIGEGTWYIEQADSKTAVGALRRGLDLGMTHIDTAEMYGSGAAETLVGEAIAGRREEVFLVSKVLPHNASRNGTIAACERSLKRLRTDRLDCYLLHWRGSHPSEENAAAVVAYSPFGHAGGFPGSHTAGGRVLKEVAERHSATPRQIALRFLTRRDSLFAIPKAAAPAHAEENAGAAALDLSAAELVKIDAAFLLGARPRSLPML